MEYVIQFIFQPEGDKVELDDYNGIDMLGNMMESSLVSIDREYYGDIHNMGVYSLPLNRFISFSHYIRFNKIEK